MAERIWYVNALQQKIVLAAGAAPHDIGRLVAQDDGDVFLSLWRAKGQQITQAEADAANATISPDQPPARRQGPALPNDPYIRDTEVAKLTAALAAPPAIAAPVAPGTLYAQAEAAATRNALVSVIGVLRSAGLVAP